MYAKESIKLDASAVSIFIVSLFIFSRILVPKQ